jgi:hypothetical protein
MHQTSNTLQIQDDIKPRSKHARDDVSHTSINALSILFESTPSQMKRFQKPSLVQTTQTSKTDLRLASEHSSFCEELLHDIVNRDRAWQPRA